MQKEIPPDLGPAGQALWTETMAQYVLDPAETSILLQMCRTTDTLGRLESQMATAAVTVSGSRGQVIAHPLLSEIRLQSMTLAKLAKTLALPQPKAAAPRRGRMPGVVPMRRES